MKDLLTEWEDVPFNKTLEEIRLFNSFLEQFDFDKEKGVVFVMCREPQEIQKFVDRLGAKTVCVRREEAENAAVSNHADKEVLNYKYDYYIDNNYSLEHLQLAAKAFLKSI